MKQMYKRVAVGVLAGLGLVALFIFQRANFAGLLVEAPSQQTAFFINRTIRFLANDFFAIGLIYALFFERKYVLFALWVQMIGMITLLIPYFVLKYHWPSYNGPLINFLHRIILNPTLLLLLIPAFYVQRRQTSKN